MLYSVDARPGQNIDEFAAELVTLAWQTQETVLGNFNQFTLRAKPGMTREKVMADWNKAQRDSYFGKKQ